MEDDDYTDSECEYGADIHDPKDDSDSSSEALLEAPLEAQSTSAKSGPSTSTTADVLKRSSLPPLGLKQR